MISDEANKHTVCYTVCLCASSVLLHCTQNGAVPVQRDNVRTLASAFTGKVGVAVVAFLAAAHVASPVVVGDVVAGAVAAAAGAPRRIRGA